LSAELTKKRTPSDCFLPTGTKNPAMYTLLSIHGIQNSCKSFVLTEIRWE